MTGPPRCLVTELSATSCLPSGFSPDRSIAMDRAHSELVKFAFHDSDLDDVGRILNRIYQRCLAISKNTVGAGVVDRRGECTERLPDVGDGQDEGRSSAAQCR